jgi:hypothetical protein
MAQTPQQMLSALSRYTSLGVKLLPCVFVDENTERYRPIQKKEKWAYLATSDIAIIEKYINGGELWTGYDSKTQSSLKQRITLFRFIPKDHNLIVLDIDRGHRAGADGVENFYKWLEADNIYKPQLPSYLQYIEKYPCYVTTPRGGFHLYFRCCEHETRRILDSLEKEKKLADNLTNDVEVFYHKPITAAGSVKNSGSYLLFGDIENARELDPIILRRIQKKESISLKTHHNIAQAKPGYIKHSPGSTRKKDIDSYRGRVSEYLHIKGIIENKSGFIPCLCHRDGATPNMKVYDDHLYCFSCHERLDIFQAACIISGISIGPKIFPEAIEEVKKTLGY